MARIEVQFCGDYVCHVVSRDAERKVGIARVDSRQSDDPPDADRMGEYNDELCCSQCGRPLSDIQWIPID